MFRRWYWLGFFIVLSGELRAENGRVIVGTTVNLTAGDTNVFGPSGYNAKQPLMFFYGAYPTVTLDARGSRSLLSTSYSYGQDRTNTHPNFKHESHAASMKFSRRVSKEWTLRLSESFDITSDATTFNALRNVAADPSASFLFYPVSARISARSNTATFGADSRLSDRSTLTFTVGHSMHDYGSGGTGAVGAALANQQTVSGGLTYSYRRGKKETWSFGYTSAYVNPSSYFNLSHFENAFSQSPYVEYANEVSPGLVVDVKAGVSRINSQGTPDAYTGYNATTSVRKTVHTSIFSIYARQTSGETSGLGSISVTQGGGMSFVHDSRKATFFMDASAFNTRGILDNTYNARVYAATASVGIPLTRTLYVQVGGQYQQSDGLQAFNFTQKRVFISIRYHNPALKKF